MPTLLTQRLSRTLYNTDGVTTVWNFAFSDGYLDAAHVKARTDSANGVRTDIPVTLDMLVGEFQLRIAPPLPDGLVLTIYRDTPKTGPLVNFADESGFSEVSLDTNARQAIMVAAETADEVTTSDIGVAGEAASAASASAADAEASRVAAESAQAVAEAALASFAGVYLGALPIAPASATSGSLYWDTTLQRLRIWDGTAWSTAEVAGGASGLSSAQVTYTYSGGVETTVESKLWETVSVKDFGASGDSVTDDTAAVQAALNSGPFRRVYFPTGVYLVGPLTVGRDVTLVGDGLTNSQLYLKDGSTGALLTAHNATHFAMQDLGLGGNKAGCPSGTHCLYITGAESSGVGFWIDRCGFFDARSNGLYQIGNYSYGRIADCIAEGNSLDGIAFNASTMMVRGNRCVSNGRFGILSFGNWSTISNNQASNNGQLVTSGAGIGVVSGDHAVVTGNTCLSNGTGALFAHGIQFNGVTAGIQQGNLCQGNNGSGLDMYQSPHSTCSGNQSLGNLLRGIEVDTASTYSTVTGNVVNGNREIGISVYNTVGVSITSNSLSGNGFGGTAVNPLSGGAGLPYGIALHGPGSYGHYTSIQGNVIANHTGSGSNGVGVWLDSACTQVTLTNNHLSANTTNLTAVKNNFSCISGNLNVPTEIRGTVTVAAESAQTVHTFATPLAFAPTIGTITLTAANSPYNTSVNITPVISAPSVNGFTVTISGDPGGSGVSYGYHVKTHPV